ncbi:hypothetical protein CWI75_04210 [Kineobactrum sediminis]|uniref:Tetratricopeptide repeat protein n=1 Tax=Kineobactrum sediminis TaxID=1905677 RepID=A0A2N5Y5B2_9GAMM|nr:tetratricopeptide repeat protein [Kineobactrum sediminis]PLW83562.1 hypothetical protein CWI75_04210 [Kineobactrum sediminis]
MKLSKSTMWLRSAFLAVPVVAAQVVVTQVQTELDWLPLGIAVAQEEQPEQETRRTPALRNKVYERLQEAQVAAEANDFTTAAQVLDSMLAAGGKNELNSYELANVYNLYAFVHYSREDYGKAIAAYENVIRQPEIPLAMEINTKYTIAQLYFVEEKWRQGLNTLLEWFDLTETPPASAYVLLSQAYYQLEDYPKALANVERAINMQEEKGKLPKEQWYNLARFLYFDKNDINSAVDVLRKLLTHYPDKQYWVQLSHMFGEQERESVQLAAMETAYVQDLLDRGSEQVSMAYLYLNGEVPYKAAKVMDRGLKDESIEATSRHYEVLGNAWRQAQEVDKAIPAMETAAAKSEDGELYARLGNIYLDGDEYTKAIAAINKGLSRGGVNRPDTARLALGMAYFNNEQYDKAREAFKAAGRDERSERHASQWIKYMESELDRQRQLQDGG